MVHTSGRELPGITAAAATSTTTSLDLTPLQTKRNIC